MQESTVWNGSIASFDGSVGCRLCMICFGFSGGVVSVGMIIGNFVVAGINHWLSFFLGSTMGREERAKYNKLQPSYHFRVTTG